MARILSILILFISSNCIAGDSIKNSYGQTKATRTKSGNYYDSYGKYIGKQSGNNFYDKNNKNIGSGKGYHPNVGGSNGLNKR